MHEDQFQIDQDQVHQFRIVEYHSITLEVMAERHQPFHDLEFAESHREKRQQD